MANHKIIKAKVKADGRTIMVYKLKTGKYNIFLGDQLSISLLESQPHMEQFDKEDLEFISESQM